MSINLNISDLINKTKSLKKSFIEKNTICNFKMYHSTLTDNKEPRLWQIFQRSLFVNFVYEFHSGKANLKSHVCRYLSVSNV